MSQTGSRSFPTGLEALKTKAKILQKTKAKNGVEIQLKDALQLLATSAGYSSWRELKDNFDSTDHFSPGGTSAHWKTWYNSYEEALEHGLKTNEFLIPYRRQFFVCESHYIEFLGIDLDDKDLQKAGRDWVKPKDLTAFQKISDRIKKKFS